MHRFAQSGLAVALCGASALAASTSGVAAGPMGFSRASGLGQTTAVENAHYRGYRGGYHRPGYGGYYRPGYGGYYRPGYGGHYGPGYGAAGVAAGVAGATAGLLGAGIAGATGYPGYGYGPAYGGGYGGNPCWRWDPMAGWVWGCR